MMEFIRARRSAVRRSLLAASVLAGLGTTPALALDVDAGDYTAGIPAGTNLAIGYFVYAHRGELHAKPGPDVPNSQLDSEIGIARFVHYFDFFGMQADVQVIAPFGSLNSAEIGGQSIKSASGLGDTIFGFGVWPYVNVATKTTIGTQVFLQAPIGSYNRNDALNLGANRFVGTAQAALIQGIGDRFLFDLIVDAAFYSDNGELATPNASLSTTPTYEIQPWLRYKPTAGSEIAIGYAAVLGGVSKAGGLRQGDAQTQSVRLQGIQFINPTLNAQVLLARDVQVDNGFRRDISVQVRLLKIF